MTPFSVEASVVMVGKFSPSGRILAELSRVGALPQAELEAAEVLALLHQQFAEVSFAWGRVLVANDRLQVEAKQVPMVRALDLMAKYVREIEPTATARMAGVNTTVLYRYTSAADRNDLARRMINFAGWGSWGKDILKSLDDGDPGKSRSGMTGATIRMGDLTDREAGWIDARVEPGASHASGFDVLVRVNDHFQLDPEKHPARSDAVGTTVLLEQLEKVFDSSVIRALDISNGVIAGGQ
jgi:hypothetical protein